MSKLVEEIKKRNNYTITPKKCMQCKYYCPDMSSDNFGPGDLCVRNPDLIFKVCVFAVCDKWEINNKSSNK